MNRTAESGSSLTTIYEYHANHNGHERASMMSCELFVRRASMGENIYDDGELETKDN